MEDIRMKKWVEIGSLVQAIVVVLGFTLACWELIIKDRESERINKQAVLEMFQELEMKPNQEYMKLYAYLKCKESSEKSTCDFYNVPKEGIGYHTLENERGSVTSDIYKVSVCYASGLCDQALFKEVFCPMILLDAEFNELFGKEIGTPLANSKVVSDTIQACGGFEYLTRERHG